MCHDNVKASWLGRWHWLGKRWLAAIYGERHVQRGDVVLQSPTVWQCPPEGWITLNLDRDRECRTGLAAYWGMVRNGAVEWMVGFTKFLSIC
ncbi:hypothetical protein V6N11_082829 [Hibiscus sabdariffa]|uniref:Uncharacterized protein n=1 Tax=Hibiscus sabdariffa TaxID=183260 RepID=A0ABR2QK15_9ROSI